MRMAVLQHVEFEGPAAVADWAAARGFPLRVFHLYRDTALPSFSDFDMLTVMGGPMSANDEAQLGWLGPEIALVREAIAADKIVLGICLGAQLQTGHRSCFRHSRCRTSSSSPRRSFKPATGLTEPSMA